jgi:hypothetical protein
VAQDRYAKPPEASIKMISIVTLAMRKGAMFMSPPIPKTRSSRKIKKTKLAITNPTRHNALGISQPFWLVADKFTGAPLGSNNFLLAANTFGWFAPAG